MGDNTLSDIKSYTYFDPDHFRKTYPTKFDILLFVTIPNSDNKSNMLLFRDYTKNLPTLGRQKKIVLFKEFLDVLDTKKNNKLLRNRVGGSSGLTQTPDNILKFFHTHNSTPRKGKGVVLLRDKNSLKWRFFYISTKNGSVKTYTYGNPQIGGNFYMKNNIYLFEKYPFLNNFCMSKTFSTLVISSLGLDNVINPIAMKSELKKLDDVSKLVHNVAHCSKEYHRDDWINMSTQDKICIVYSHDYDTYTLVCHPVGRHNDSFKRENSSSIENRFCMCFELDSNLQTNIQKIDSRDFPYGRRGGNGSNYYSFAVLDW